MISKQKEALTKAQEGNQIKEKIKELKKLVDEREENRLKYDHYRTKLTKMEKEDKASTSNNVKD